ncbi:hypothetical protein [Tengunoibacter tsumagoiensis]|uniref:Uncharacterized protein n=1 Tax=Tengunoibacter tsumagoiensis TaxID=2014871 RepID=A0A401ZXD7_9CHLR|nr:hypothetical protein [Tengunoibacter tsumagoiensis]GCE11518.1 hypothetical protein KTT_13770 [Tengunoibacter tsumagoiensis]
MRKQYLRWLLPIIALLVIATVIVLSPLVNSHAAGTTSPSVTPTSTPHVTPDVQWHF